VFQISCDLMSAHHVHTADDRLDRLTFIECLLEEYRMTKDRRLLRRAIELWNEVEAERAQEKTPIDKQIH
jgi:hypothetical protein